MGIERPEQVEERARRPEITAIRPEMHTGDGDLLEAFGPYPIDFVAHRIDR